MTDNNGEQAQQAQREARRNRQLAWAWSIVLIPPAVVLYFCVSLEVFTAVTVLATWILSVVTLSVTQASVAKGAEAKAASYENPSDDQSHKDSWSGEMPGDPLREATMDPPPSLTAELAPPPPAPTYVDPDEWGMGRYL